MELFKTTHSIGSNHKFMTEQTFSHVAMNFYLQKPVRNRLLNTTVSRSE